MTAFGSVVEGDQRRTSQESERGLNMSDIHSIGYCELAEIRAWKIHDHLDLVPGGPGSGCTAICWSPTAILLQRKRNITHKDVGRHSLASQTRYIFHPSDLH